MTTITAAPGSIAKRVSVAGCISVALVLFGICAVMSVVATDLSRQRIVTWVGDKSQSVSDVADAFDATSRATIQRLFSVFKQDFDTTFTHDDATGDMGTFGTSLKDNFSAVDKFSQITGGVATVFSRKDDDFVRITTSLKKENGERALGTLLGKQHPAFAGLLEGKTYVGRAMLFGKPYMTLYEPARDASGKIVGALFVGLDLSAFQTSLEALANDIKFFESGGVYVIDPKKSLADAVFVVHPSAKGKKVSDEHALPVAEIKGAVIEELKPSGRRARSRSHRAQAVA